MASGDVSDITHKTGMPLNDNMTAEEVVFTKKLRKFGDFEKIELSAVTRLGDTFNHVASQDPYSISPAYYALTGRRSLWSWTPDDNTTVLFCLHPNLKNTVIIFPPFVHGTDSAQEAMQKFLEIMQKAESGLQFQIGRVPAKEPVKEALLGVQGFNARVVDENILDWAYPVPTYDLTQMRQRKGGKYAALRQALHSIDRKFQVNEPGSRLNLKEIDFHSKQSIYDLNMLVGAWENNAKAKGTHPHIERYTIEDDDYFDHLFRMARVHELNLRGMFLMLDGKPQGFAIWEAPVGNSATANVFASQVAIFNTANDATTTPHWSTGMIYKMGREIHNTGGQKMCLGGSETEEQFRFKQKFVPEITFPLVTIALTVEAKKAMELPKPLLPVTDEKEIPPVPLQAARTITNDF